MGETPMPQGMQTLDYAPPTQSRQLEYWQRAGLFALAAMSIWSLLVEFYGVMSMRTFVLWIFLPAMLAMLIWAAIERGYVWRVVWIGAVAGFIAACAYDVFRVPFVFARELRIDSVVPALPLFKVFPEVGRMIAGEYGARWAPDEPGRVLALRLEYTAIGHLTGWAYHFSNGMTFGIMYVALIGDAVRRSWLWAVVFAVVLELGMLFTPYPRFFGINVTPTFIAVTLIAHVVFGIALGLSAKWLWRRANRRSRSFAAA